MDNRDPFIFKTADYGKTWTKISDGLPRGHPLAYVLNVAENPNRRGMLFAGTGNGFFYSMNDGATWTQFKDGLPGRAGHLDRGAARSITTSRCRPTAAACTSCATSRASSSRTGSTRTRQPSCMRRARVSAKAASGSAEFLYSLKAASGDPVAFEILDASGAVLRRLTGPARAGLNRATWDLRYEPPAQVELRTIPPDNPHIWEEARFKGQQTRPIRPLGHPAGRARRAAGGAGRYTVRMIGGRPDVCRSRSRSSGTRTSRPRRRISRQRRRPAVRIRDALERARWRSINRLEVMRKQIEDLLISAGRQDGRWCRRCATSTRR